MKSGRASRTADIAVMYRAAEALKSEKKRVCHDPYAKYFLNRMLRLIFKSRFCVWLILWYADKVAPGTRGWTIGRYRYIDESLMTRIADGIKQLVILGAGYDTRAYRFDMLLKGKVRVFEVDHPDTQKMKVKAIRKLFGIVPEHVTYVAIDFEKDSFEKKLSESGYNRDAKTLFIWEAVTMYLTEEGVVRTLNFVANNSGEGSSVIFDYMLRLENCETRELKKIRKFQSEVKRRGDPIAFDIRGDNVEEFLSRKGFYQIDITTGEALRSAYFKGSNQYIDIASFFGYVHAMVET